MYRLHSHIDESLNVVFESLEKMQAYAEQHEISPDDATMEQWSDERYQEIQ